MPDELENSSANSPYDGHAFQKVSDGCIIGRPACQYCTYGFNAATAFCAFM